MPKIRLDRATDQEKGEDNFGYAQHYRRTKSENIARAENPCGGYLYFAHRASGRLPLQKRSERCAGIKRRNAASCLALERNFMQLLQERHDDVAFLSGVHFTATSSGLGSSSPTMTWSIDGFHFGWAVGWRVHRLTPARRSRRSAAPPQAPGARVTQP